MGRWRTPNRQNSNSFYPAQVKAGEYLLYSNRKQSLLKGSFQRPELKGPRLEYTSPGRLRWVATESGSRHPTYPTIAHNTSIGMHANDSSPPSPIGTSDPQFVATRGHLGQALFLYKWGGLLVKDRCLEPCGMHSRINGLEIKISAGICAQGSARS